MNERNNGRRRVGCLHSPFCTFHFSFYIILLAASGRASAAEDRSLEAKLRPLVKAHRGEVAIAVKQLKTGATCGIREDEPLPAASLIKLAVMVETYRQSGAGKVDLAAKVTLRKDDRVPGSGVLARHFSDGVVLPLRDAVRLMIAYSDNTATNLVLDRIGLRSVSAEMARLGLSNTQLHSKVFLRETSIAPERSTKFGLASTTARETVRLLELIETRQFLPSAACDEMLGHLQTSEDKSCFRALLPEGAVLGEKTGAVSGVRTAAGLLKSRLGPIALCVLTNKNSDARWTDDNDGNRLCAAIARLVVDHFNEESADGKPPLPDLAEGATGPEVEALQRTLNRRLTSSDLSVDGEFGAGTRAAVIKFQKSSNLPVTGIVDGATRAKLGPFVLVDDPVPEPDVVNAQKLPRLPADPLDGPPFLTCRAWAVGDPRTGTPIGGKDDEARLEIASVTKLMTAAVVLRLARKEPDTLRETVTVGASSARVGGSTAALQAGDRLSVEDLLYGLLLPSGNDAAAALAEHFGPRFRPAGEVGAKLGAAECFVFEMNRTAAELGLKETSYKNPHGLPERGHLSTARDQFLLASALVRETPLLEYTGTRQRGCRIGNISGRSRNAIWKNTNRLLETEGYLGLKTGTTSGAGSCLVSLGERGDQRLIVVVLGSTGADAREADTRNLFRWGWRQR